MKHTYVALLLVAFITFLSCSRNNTTANGADDNAFNTNQPPSGSYRISLYWDDRDETSDFAGYAFEFNSGGLLKATRAGVVTTGTWSENTSSRKFIINFPAGNLAELNDDWLIEEKTPNTIKLKEDNPSKDDKLHFTKQ